MTNDCWKSGGMGTTLVIPVCRQATVRKTHKSGPTGAGNGRRAAPGQTGETDYPLVLRLRAGLCAGKLRGTS